jgi:hypothetical protein
MFARRQPLLEAVLRSAAVGRCESQPTAGYLTASFLAAALAPDSAVSTEVHEDIESATFFSAVVLSVRLTLSALAALSVDRASSLTLGVSSTSVTPAAVERVALTMAVTSPGTAPTTTTSAVASSMLMCVVATMIATTAAANPVVDSAGRFVARD